MKVLTISLLVAVLTGLSFGQQTTADEWTNISSKNGHFSMSLPSDFLVFKNPDRKETNILARLGDVSFKVTFAESQPDFSGLAYLRQHFKLEAGMVSKDFSLEKFEITTQTLERKFYNLSILCAEQGVMYSISISAKSKLDKNLEAALRSIRLNQKPLFDQLQNGDSKPTKYLSVASLNTSPLIQSALDHDQKSDIEIKMSETKANPSSADTLYSRQLLLLRKERPPYTDLARRRDVQGTIELEIVFKGDGNIGKVSVVRGLGSGLNEEAVRVAKRIKFLPAEIDGKPVEVTKSVEYNFAIY